MRAQVVLLRGGRILLARHERASGGYWVLPGGEIEADETPEEAAVREVLEETGLRIRVERLLFVDGPRVDSGIVIKRPRYTFLGTLVDGELEAKADETGHRHKGRFVGAKWMSFEDPEYDVATRDTLRLVRKALG